MLSAGSRRRLQRIGPLSMNNCWNYVDPFKGSNTGPSSQG